MSKSNQDQPSNVIPLPPRAGKNPCPICKKPAVADYRPFCSKRCADIDLHRWLGEDYRVPSQEPPDWEDGA